MNCGGEGRQIVSRGLRIDNYNPFNDPVGSSSQVLYTSHTDALDALCSDRSHRVHLACPMVSVGI